MPVIHPTLPAFSMASHKLGLVIFVVIIIFSTLSPIDAHENCHRGFKTCKKGGSCKTDVRSDPNNCGKCGGKCLCAPHTEPPKCKNGHCTFECEWRRGWRDCDSRKANGCETNINTNPNHCGSCGTVCSTPGNGTATCTRGICGTKCNAGFEKCGDTCVNVMNNDTSNCGGCGKVCPTTDNAIATCSLGVCSIQCDAGHEPCSSAGTKYCVLLDSDVNNCGTCGVTCDQPPNTIATCDAGTCSTVCSPRYADCDSEASTGCETYVFGCEVEVAECDTALSNSSSCGICGKSCADVTPNVGPPGGQVFCHQGGCKIVTCSHGYGDCDNDPANGCETYIGNALCSSF